MSHELICTWLGLPPGDWPPDHYRLLGLEPGESDCARIEQCVHQRLEAVRRYQVKHPDLVTEAMNRLAQAYVCLTDPEARRAYDARFGRPPVNGTKPAPAAPTIRVRPSLITPRPAPLTPVPAPPPEPPPPPVIESPPPAAAEPPPPLALPSLPPLPVAIPAPPVAIPVEAVTAAVPEPAVALPTAVAEALPAAPPAPPQPRPKADPAVEASRSPEARLGLGTRRALYRRLTATRRLMRAWERAGKYLGNPKRKLSRPAEATELINHLKALREALDGFPRLLGGAGQPGYSVVVLAHQPAPVPVFQTLQPGQRDILAQHWKGGRQFLQSHRELLRQEMQCHRRCGRCARAFRAARQAINDHAGTVLLIVLALFALVAAIWRQYVHFDY
jgi:hypothetical protein